MTTPDIEFDRGLPASIDAERSILGAILLDNEHVWEAAETLKTTDFALDSHMRIYSAMVRMAEAGTPIDIVTLSEDLGQFREVDAVGGVAYLFSLTEGLPRRLSITEYVKIVKDRAQLRVVIRECSMASRRAQDMQDAAADIIADLQDRMLEEQAEGESSAVKIGDVAPTIEAQVKTAQQVSEERTTVELTWGVKDLDAITKGAFGGELTILAGESGGSKLMDVNELIPTPRGYVRNGDLEDGDEVFGEDGLPYSLIKAHPIQLEESFKVTFDDGTFTHVHAGHLWHTWTFRDRQKKFKQSAEFRASVRASRPKIGKGLRPDMIIRNAQRVASYVPPPVNGSVKTTAEIAATLSVCNCERANHSIRLAKPIQASYRELPIDPYVLGVWLGDGSSESAGLTIGPADVREMGRLLAERGYPVRANGGINAFTFSNGDRRQKARNVSFQSTLRKMKLIGNKHIPGEYLWASEFQRKELLRGLMDSDGTCAQDGQSVFSNTNPDLSVGVYQLAASLGVKPVWSESRATLYGKDCGAVFEVKWTAMLDCFNLRRKANRLPKKVRKTQSWRYIVDVQPAGLREMRCLTTSNPSGLYLFGSNFNITHNTSFAVQMVLANAREGTPCGVFSIEMQKEKFVRRFYPSMGTIIKAGHMRDPRLMNLHTHVPEISRLTGELSALPIYIDDSPVGIKTLCARVRMMRRKFGIKLFVIDYFQLIEPPPSSGRMESTDVKRVIFPLRDLVKAEPSIHLLVLSQYSKAEGWIKKRKRSKSDLYGGSVIHHAAQNVILITVEDAKEKQPNELLDVEFLVDKQRDGRVGKATCMFDRDHLTFTYPQPLL